MSKFNYPKRFRAHIHDFIKKRVLFDSLDELLVLVSGGLDSMALVHILSHIHPKQKITVLHINHGTRSEQDREELMVRNYCEKLQVKCIVRKLQGLDSSAGNFELYARYARKQTVSELRKAKMKVITAHHIDDSHEWYLLSQLKSATSEALGIPVVNGAYRRPLLCVSKQQLKRYCLLENVQYLDDPTNEDDRFERNYIRKFVIPKIAERYPAYLKNYVSRMQRVAAEKGLLYRHQSVDVKVINQEHATLIYHPKLKDHHFSYEPELLKAIFRFSDQERGTIREQLKKVRKALSNSKPGPLLFSGGVAVYTDRCLLLVCKMNQSGPQATKSLSGKLSVLLPELLDLIGLQENVVLPCVELDRKSLKRIGIKLKKQNPAKKRLSLGQFLNRWAKSPERHLSFSVYY